MKAIAWLLGQIAPNAGLRYLRSSELFKRAYEGASLRDGWRPRRSGASANADHRADAATLRARARALVQNVPYVARGLGSLVANTVGTGFIPRSLSADESEAIDLLWEEWGAVADADGRTNIYGLMVLAYRTMEQDGEALIRLRARRVEDGYPVPLQLQLLEIDWLDSSKNGTSGPNTIINGIEYDPLGKKVSYWLFDQHPGESVTTRAGRAGSYPVPADRIVHLFNPERPGQGRGFTRLAPVIARVRDLQLYEDAELQRKNLETRLSVVARGDASQLNFTPVDSTPASDPRKTGELGTLGSGNIVQLPSDVTDLTVVAPTAAGGYVDYVRYQLRLIAAGMGITYEMLTGDVSGVNFSSARVALLEFRRNAEQMQWITLVPNLATPIWRAFIDAGVLAGKIRRRNYGVDWSAPRWEYVDPEKEVQADLSEIAGGLASWSEKLRMRGYKPDLVFRERKKDVDRLRSDGILDLMLMMFAKKAPQAAAGEQAPEGAEGQGSRGGTIVNVDVSSGIDAAADRLVQRATERIQEVPININVPAQPAPAVHVEVRAPEVHLTPELHVTAHIPARTTETELVRDAHGKPWKSVTTEREAAPEPKDQP